MKLSELPVYWDLIRLPLPIFVKRIKKRLWPKVENTEVPVLKNKDVKIILAKTFTLIKTDQTESPKWEYLWKHYKNNRFNYLGAGWTSIVNAYTTNGFEGKVLGKFPRPGLGNSESDWNRDQRSGFQFKINGVASQQLSKAFSTYPVDVKFCWEFARFHHFPQLAVIANFFPVQRIEIQELAMTHLTSFIAQNKYGKGIHWTSPMEVAIRLVNVAIGMDMLGLSEGKNKVVLANFLYEHYYFIKSHLEYKDGYGTNHYLANLMGLVAAGVYLDDDEVAKTANWAVTEFERELKKQFFSDGGNFEYSTYYHRLSTEIALITQQLAYLSGQNFSDSSIEIINKALALLQNLKKSDDRLPAFGDNDSGRILNLDPEGEIRANDFIPIPEKTGFIDALFKEGSLYNWFFKDTLPAGEEGANKQQAITSPSKKFSALKYSSKWEIPYAEVDPAELILYKYEETGLYIFRSANFYLAINIMANPNGHRYRGHMHNDKGSFELYVDGKELISDPGTYSYTASVKLRNVYRETKAHAIPYTGVEQNRFFDGMLGLFHLKLDVVTEVLDIGSNFLTCRILYRGVKHIRKFQIMENHLQITDWCTKKFQLSKDLIETTSGYGKLK